MILSTGNLTARVWFLKIGLFRVIRIFYVIIGTEIQFFVVCGEHIDGRGISKMPKFLYYISMPQVFRFFFDYIIMFYENNYSHGPQALWPDLSMGSGI
jgi:hypothetical protein